MLPTDKLQDYFLNSLLTYSEIAEELGATRQAVSGRFKKMFTPVQIAARKRRTYSRANTQANRPQYRGGKVHNQGYTLLARPSWYTGAPGSDYIGEHILVMCKHLRISELPTSHVVHHCDHDRSRNNLENLMLLSRSRHTVYHNEVSNETQ